MQILKKSDWDMLSTDYGELHDGLVEKVELTIDAQNYTGIIDFCFLVPKWCCSNGKANRVRIKLCNIVEMKYEILRDEIQDCYTIFEARIQWLEGLIWLDLKALSYVTMGVKEIRESSQFFVGKEAYYEITPCED